MTAPTATNAAAVQAPAPAQQNPQTDAPEAVKKDGRSYKDCSKQIAKIVGYTLLGVVAVLAVAALVAALLPYMLPAGMTAGAAVSAAAVSVGAFSAKVVTFIAANSTIFIIASSVTLGAIAIGGVTACIVVKCKKKKEDELENDSLSDATKAKNKAEQEKKAAETAAAGQTVAPVATTPLVAPPVATQPLNASTIGTPVQPQQPPVPQFTEAQIQEQMAKDKAIAALTASTTGTPVVTK